MTRLVNVVIWALRLATNFATVAESAATASAEAFEIIADVEIVAAVPPAITLSVADPSVLVSFKVPEPTGV